jgi:hypothetical protein
LDSIELFPFGSPEPHIGGARYRTALLDLLEAAEFVAEDGRWAPMSI